MFDSLLIPTIAPCRMATFLDDLDEASRRNLTEALAMPREQIPHKRIAREILAETSGPDKPGVKIDPETIAAHRNGTCRCSSK